MLIFFLAVLHIVSLNLEESIQRIGNILVDKICIDNSDCKKGERCLQYLSLFSKNEFLDRFSPKYCVKNFIPEGAVFQEKTNFISNKVAQVMKSEALDVFENKKFSANRQKPYKIICKNKSFQVPIHEFVRIPINIFENDMFDLKTNQKILPDNMIINIFPEDNDKFSKNIEELYYECNKESIEFIKLNIFISSLEGTALSDSDQTCIYSIKCGSNKKIESFKSSNDSVITNSDSRKIESSSMLANIEIPHSTADESVQLVDFPQEIVENIQLESENPTIECMDLLIKSRLYKPVEVEFDKQLFRSSYADEVDVFISTKKNSINKTIIECDYLDKSTYYALVVAKNKINTVVKSCPYTVYCLANSPPIIKCKDYPLTIYSHYSKDAEKISIDVSKVDNILFSAVDPDFDQLKIVVQSISDGLPIFSIDYSCKREIKPTRVSQQYLITAFDGLNQTVEKCTVNFQCN